jgi:hypothetical protein
VAPPDLSEYWPAALAHLREPYDDGISDHVVIAEVSEAPHGGYRGARRISTALVPLDILDDVLNHPGGIGTEVESWGPGPIVDEGEVFDTNFWIDGRKGKKDERFQTIVNSWRRHNQEVLLPDNVMLMAYGLVPRYLGDGITCWDDPQAPVYDVLHLKSHIDYGAKGANPLAQIAMRRQYLEDYCSLKRCAAVAVYYEERFSKDDRSIDEVLQAKEGEMFDLPGRVLEIKLLRDRYHAAAPQMSSAWGCKPILVPKGRPVSDAQEPSLVWPGDDKPMTFERASAKWIYGFVSDEVLVDFENRPEFSVHPESGGVSYDGWWSVGFSRRVGRNHIQVELKKLYEGTPPHIIAHWHRFAVPEAVAELDRKTHGNTNIAVRAKAVGEAFLRLTGSLQALSERMGAGFTQEDIGSLSTNGVEYVGWWTVPVLKPLGAVAKQTATREQFLGRAVSLFQLLENMKPAPLRNLALKLGIPKDEIQDVGSLSLLACIIQLAVIAAEHGHRLPEDAAAVVKLRNPDAKIPSLDSVFALHKLRVCASHAPSADQDKKISAAAAVFGVNVASTAAGWGIAIDTMYDRMAQDLAALARFLNAALK